MKAFVLHGHGDLDQLRWHEDWPAPVPGDNEVLIKVHACGLNNTDVNTRTAWYSKTVTDETTGAAFENADTQDATWGGAAISFPRIQGADVCGTVIQAGNDVNAGLIGQRVLVDTWLRDHDCEDPRQYSCGFFGSESDGGFAEYTVVDHRQAFPINSDLSNAELATFATSYVTAENMLNRANVQSGDRVLITGASGGVGTALIQLVKRRDALAIAVCSDAKAEAVKAIGADAVVSRHADDLVSVLKRDSGESSVTVVADIVGGASWASYLALLERGGRYTCAGAIGGPIVEFDLRTFYLRDLTFTGATVVPKGVFADLVGYIERSDIHPVLAASYPLSALHQAQQAFIDKTHVGNIVVTTDS